MIRPGHERDRRHYLLLPAAAPALPAAAPAPVGFEAAIAPPAPGIAEDANDSVLADWSVDESATSSAEIELIAGETQEEGDFAAGVDEWLTTLDEE